MATMKALNSKQGMSVLTYLKGTTSSKRDRNVALWAVGIGTGLRISDILDLRWKDVISGDNTISGTIKMVEGKTSQVRIIELCPMVVDALEAYRTSKTDSSRLVFDLSRQQSSRLVAQWCAAVNLRGTYGAHSMRKCFCSTVYDHSGGDVVSASRVTGHSNPSQLLAYIGQSAPTVRQIWKGVSDSFA